MDLSRARWHKSTRSDTNGQCIEVADNLSGIVAVRDSKAPEADVLTFAPSQWASFVEAVKRGELRTG